MKKIFYTLFALSLTVFSVKQSNAQATSGVQDLFCETFDTLASNWRITRSNIPVTRPQFFQLDTIVTKDRSFGAATDSVGILTESYLTTPLIDIRGFLNVGLAFDHICYIEQFDDATIQISLDSGNTWNRLPPSSYNGTRFYDWGQGDFKFTKFSSLTLWPNNISNFVFTSNTNQWVTENFDLTPIITAAGGNFAIMIRFALIDDSNSPIGSTGTHRWIIDNVCVRGSDCEVIPPLINLLEPPRNYPARYEGRVYSIGPYDFDAQMTDASLVDTAFVEAILIRDTMLNGFPWDTLAIDTFPMTRRPGNNFRGQIPQTFKGYTVTVGDTLLWKVVGIDGSDCANLAQDPPVGFSKFQVVNNLPPSCTTQPIFEFPYYQDFNGFEFIQGTPGQIGDRWSNLTGDFHEWWVHSGSTPTDSTGPSDDIPGGGKYLYVESSKSAGVGSFKDSTASIVTPCFDFDSLVLPNGIVRFYVNMNTTNIEDEITVDAFDPTPRPGFPNGRFVNNVIPPITGFKGDNWIPFEFSTFQFKNKVTQFRFNGTPGTDNGLGDMALDSFSIKRAALTDLRMNSVNLGVFNPENDIQTLNVNIQNLGVAAADVISFYYELTELQGGAVVRPIQGPVTLTGINLLPGESRNIDISGLTYQVPFGLYEIKAWLDYLPDSVPQNDTAFSQSNGIFNFPIDCRKDFFDDRNLWLTFSDGNPLTNKWELGTPNFGRINSAYSGPNSWTILLDRPYTGEGTTVNLISPFFDFTNKNDVVLSFLNNRSIDTTEDGVFIEFSFDRGVTWDLLDENLADTRIKRWYNNSLSSGGLGGVPVLADVSSCQANTWDGWYETEMLLPDTLEGESEVLFRFNFFAENDDDGDDGFSMDNFLIYQPEPIDIEPQHLLSPTSECDLKVNQRFKTIIKNRGTQAVVDTFEIEYRIFDVNNQTMEVKTEKIGRTIPSRDTIHVVSSPTFDMFSFGDYEVDIITKINADGCSINDTLSKLIENIDGCRFEFRMIVDRRFNMQLPCDSTVWRFNYVNGDRNYQVSGAYNDPNFPIGFGANLPGDTIKGLEVCVKSGSRVQVDLGDRDTLIKEYSLIAFNGENDTIIKNEIPGGPDSPIEIFDWVCPPKRSAQPLTIIVDSFKVRLPLPGDFAFDLVLENDGTDSLDNVNINLQVDNNALLTTQTDFIPPLQYLRKKRAVFPKQFLGPGVHDVTIYTDLPNRQFDMLPERDTLRTTVIVMDTVRDVDVINNIPPGDSVPRPNFYGPFCDNFEGDVDIEWVVLNPRTASQQNISWERGMPNQANVNGTSSGMNAYATGLNEDYPNLDESALISPLIFLERDSCYEISFMHNYFIEDSILDGGTFRVIRNQDLQNGQVQVGNVLGDTTGILTFDPITGDPIGFRQSGWFNTLHIFSIPDNTQNAGWRGNSRGWKRAANTITGDNEFVAFMWRFQSDGTVRSQGWAVDDFCIQNIDPLFCFPVGIEEAKLNKNNIFLGQNIPNPASYSTSIPYYLPKGGQVEFIVGNLLGQIVHQETSSKPMGEGLLELDLNNLTKGVYFYSMVFEGQRITKKMIITK